MPALLGSLFSSRLFVPLHSPKRVGYEEGLGGAVELRRKIPRQPAEWFGTYHYDFDTHGGPRRCRVLDISAAGAGLQLLDTSLAETMDRLVIVSLELQGDMRSAVPWDDGVRVGIEFPELSGNAADYVKTLRNSSSGS